MDRFIMNFMLFLEVHFGKQINNPPLRWWIERNEGTFKEVRIISDFNTIVFVRASNQPVPTRHHNKPVFIMNRTETGVKIDPETGKVSMWTKESTNRKSKKAYYKKVNFFQFMQTVNNFKVQVYAPGTEDQIGLWGREVISEYIPLVDEFLAHHNAKSLKDLCIPAAEAFGMSGDGQWRTPWMDFALGARDLAAFWTRMGRTVKLAKDEKRALVALIKHDERYMAFARMATRIHIPNVRTLTIPQAQVREDRWGFGGGRRMEDPWQFSIPNSDAVNVWMMGLRKVEPHRRVMFLQNWGFEAVDALTMLARLRKAGEVEMVNQPSVHAYHEYARLAMRLLETKNREIPEITANLPVPTITGDRAITDKMAINGYPIGNTGMVCITPDDTHMVIAWGERQEHCIGTYANQAADGRTILLGFKRGDEWVGHCSINNRRCTQLLGRFNRRLDPADSYPIMKWLKAVGLIDEATAGYY